MLDQPRRRRQGVELETNTAPDQLNDDLHRRTEQQTSSDSALLAKRGIPRTNPQVADLRLTPVQHRTTMSGKLTVWTRLFGRARANVAFKRLLCRGNDHLLCLRL